MPRRYHFFNFDELVLAMYDNKILDDNNKFIDKSDNGIDYFVVNVITDDQNLDETETETFNYLNIDEGEEDFRLKSFKLSLSTEIDFPLALDTVKGAYVGVKKSIKQYSIKEKQEWGENLTDVALTYSHYSYYSTEDQEKNHLKIDSDYDFVFCGKKFFVFV